MIRKILIPFLLSIWIPFTASAHANHVFVIANVDGIPITNIDCLERIKILEKITKQEVTREEKKLIVDTLIDEIIISKTAEKMNIVPDMEEIDKSIEIYNKTDLSESEKDVIRTYATTSYLMNKIVEINVISKISMDQEFIEQELIRMVNDHDTADTVSFTKYSFPDKKHSTKQIKEHIRNNMKNIDSDVKVKEIKDIKINTLNSKIKQSVQERSVESFTDPILIDDKKVVLYISDKNNSLITNGKIEGFFTYDQSISSRENIIQACRDNQNKFVAYSPMSEDMLLHTHLKPLEINEKERFIICNNTLQTFITNKLYQEKVMEQIGEYMKNIREEHIITKNDERIKIMYSN